ncbi:MAG: short chain dehydrogenase family protein [Deltaproteobacteria bacterium]|nr:short chain dehydrogenase family protein [Deltaproteobacteria bacterium]
MKRRVLVTGGSRGIGAAIAARLARDGFAIAVNYRERADAAQATVAAIREHGGEASALCFDVADREACARELARDLESGGPYYGVVCNAGTHADAPFPGMSGDAWDRVLTTNLDGFYNVLHPLVMPMIRARQGGRIVTISSVSGLAGNRGQTNYSASKAGLIAATRSLALELAKRGITANSARRRADRRAHEADSDAPHRAIARGRGGRRVPVFRRGFLHHRAGAGRERGPGVNPRVVAFGGMALYCVASTVPGEAGSESTRTSRSVSTSTS